MRIDEVTTAADIEKQAKGYVKPLMAKWHEALNIQSKLGKDIEDSKTQQLILGGIIARYAKLGAGDVAPLQKKISAADLTNDAQVSDILKTAVMMTLYQRTAAPRRTAKADDSTHDDAETESTPPEGALVRDNGVPYYFHNGKWYGLNDDLPVRIQQLTDVLTARAITMWRRGKLTLRK